MLSSISWQHYLEAILVITILYYLFIAVRYYPTEISSLLKPNNNLPAVPGTRFSSLNIMGAPFPDQDVALNDPEDLRFSGQTPDDPDIPSSDAPLQQETKTTPNSVTEEFLAESVNLIAAFTGVDDKEEFLKLLALLIQSFAQHKDEMNMAAALDTVVSLAKEKLNFVFEKTDIRYDW